MPGRIPKAFASIDRRLTSSRRWKRTGEHLIVYLPDPDEEYLIRVLSGVGAVDAKATLENGWNLTALGETRDSKIPETITAVGGLLTAVKPRVVPPAEKPVECRPGISKLTYDKESHAWDIPREAR